MSIMPISMIHKKMIVLAALIIFMAPICAASITERIDESRAKLKSQLSERRKSRSDEAKKLKVQIKDMTTGQVQKEIRSRSEELLERNGLCRNKTLPEKSQTVKNITQKK
jgi:hypothetical protein